MPPHRRPVNAPHVQTVREGAPRRTGRACEFVSQGRHRIRRRRVPHGQRRRTMASGNSNNNALAKFTVDKAGDAYRFSIEDDAGGAIELSATFEQVELLADAL